MSVEVPLLVRMLRAAASQADKLPPTELTDDLVAWALEAGFGPLLLYLLGNDTTSIARPYRALLLAANQLAETQTHKLISATVELIDGCQNLRRPVTLLKGISVCQQYYPKPHFRSMCDVDILADRADLESVRAILLALGYEQRSTMAAEYYVGHHHLMPFHHSETGVCIEIHTDLFRTDARLAEATQLGFHAMLSETVPSHFEGRNVLRFSDEFQLLYTATHWAREYPSNNRLLPLLDCVYLIKRTHAHLDWERIVHWLRDVGPAIPLAVVLGYLVRNEIIAPPLDIRRALESSKRPATKVAIAILHRIMEGELPDGAPFAAALDHQNLGIVWGALVRRYPARKNLASIPFHLLFPPENPRRFRLGYQIQRLRNFLG